MKRMNVWRGLTARIMSWMLLLSVVAMVSCSDDDDASAAAVTVNFDAAAQSLRESDEAATVLMKLSGAATRDGILTFSLETTAVYGTDYTTNPRATDNKVVVPVIKGQTAVKFNVFPVDNTTLTGDRTIKITLSAADAGFQIGEKSSQVITLIDDEGPSKLNFAVSEGTLSSSEAEGKKVLITLSSKAPSAGTVKVSIASTGATYGTHYTTTPAAADNAIEVPIAAGATEASFTVIPGTISADVDVTFTLGSATGGVELGSLTAYKLTLSPSNIISVATLRDMFKGTVLVIDQDVAISGVVISKQDNVTDRNIWLHDGTKGIQVRFTAKHAFVLGDKLTIKIKGASLGEFNGTLQLGSAQDSTVPLTNATKTGTEELPAYKTITIAQLNTGSFEGDLVKVENVKFTAADGIRVLNQTGTGAGNNAFTDAGATATGVLRVESYATFKGNVVPLGSGNIQGIANEYNGAGQVTPQSAADIFQSNTTASIIVSPASLDFGDVANGAESTVKTYTVSGSNLTGDVTVTAPQYYSVSLSETGTYDATATITANAANSGAVTVYAKFKPLSGTNQALAGAITNTSANAVAQSVAVTGNETGNVPSTAETIVLWTFEGDVSTPETDVNGGATIEENTVGNPTYVAGNGPSGNRAWNNNNWAVDTYAQVNVNATGFNNLKVSFDTYRSATGPVALKVQYSADGATFTDLPNAAVSLTDPTKWTTNSFDLSAIPALNDNATVAFRFVITTTGTGATGTLRYDNVTVLGSR